MRVKDVVATKGTAVVTIAPTATIAELVASLAENRIGAIVVSTDGRSPAGIVSERDIARALANHGTDLLGLPVSAIMTSPVHTCALQDEVSSLARAMTDGRFRHIPVVEGGALAGIVSIGDIVKKRIDELEAQHEQLIGYISSGG